jgi:PAS domain-containing protein
MTDPIKDHAALNLKLSEELAVAKKEILLQNEEKAKRADELGIANIELLFQNEEKAKRAAELVIANIEKTKLSAELMVAKNGLLFPNKEKGQIPEKYSRFLLENSPAAIRIASKLTGKVLFANQSFCELTGEPLERAIGLDPRQFYTNQNDYDDILDCLGRGGEHH